MLKSRLSTLLAISLLLVTSGAFAAKANPEDCPCLTAMIEAMAITACTAFAFSESHTVKFGIYEKTLSFGESTGENCDTSFILSNSTGSKGTFCQVDFGGEIRGESCTFGRVFVGGNNLTPVQEKACDTAIKQFKREVNKLPDCYVGCPSPCDPGD